MVNKKNDFNTINLIQTLMKPLFMFITLFIFAHSSVYASDDSQKIEETARYVLSQATIPTISSTSGEWAVIGISHSGLNVPDSYFDSYNARVSNILDEKNGNLGRKYTEYSRIAIALNSIGAPTSNIGEKRFNLFSYINDYDKVILQGINGPIFALTAKVLCGDSDIETAQKYKEFILNHQNSDGSFGLSQNMPDTDITAMAISALSLCNDSQEIDNAINKAFLYLSSIQKNDGSFTANPNESEGNSESISQVIIAMKRYGLSPHDSFFTKNGYTPYDALDSYRISGGGYLHLKSDADANQIASEQALLALTEVQKPANMLIYDRIWFDANVKYLESITK